MGLRRIVRAGVIAAVALAIAAPADATHRGPGSSRGLEAAWVQLEPSSAVLVRALTEDNECPHAVFDRKAVRNLTLPLGSRSFGSMGRATALTTR